MELRQCTSLAEVREEIDKLDDQIVELIGARNAYVHQAARFKESVAEVKAADRIDDVLQRVRHKALALGVSPNLLTEIYTLMIDEMVESEIAEFRNLGKF